MFLPFLHFLLCFLTHYSFFFSCEQRKPISEFDVPVPVLEPVNQELYNMSCNGCRILRKGCSEDCNLRQSLQWIDSPKAQANATVFVAKFFGRAGLMSSISSVPLNQRPSLFQSLLFEAVGRTVNPVSGAVGLLWTGNWDICQTAVMTVLRGGTVEPLIEFEGGILAPDYDNVSECASFRLRNHHINPQTNPTILKRKRSDLDETKCEPTNLDLCLMYSPEKLRAATPSEEESETRTLWSGGDRIQRGETKLLSLFI